MIAFLAFSFLAGCSIWKHSDVQQQLEGSTMGTTYSIRYCPGEDTPSAITLQHLIEIELSKVNQQMSTYLKDSEISVFNDALSSDWVAVSTETAQVIELAQSISVTSKGAFDITVGPIVDLWGFGPEKGAEKIPSETELESARARVGFTQLEVSLDPPAIKKSNPAVRIDLSAIAKGHGVDRVGSLLANHGIKNYFVEIGGEIVTRGTRPNAQSWQIGIETPQFGPRSIQSIIGLSDAAIATSGDYRNYFEHEGKRYSHTIDPSTGRPITHQLASASVVADNCALADAIATCMMVLGPDRGLALADANEWAVFLIQRNEDSLISSSSSQFERRFPNVSSRSSIVDQGLAASPP